MNHEEQIILYAANQLDGNARTDFEKHLAGCADCQMDLLLWQSVADELTASVPPVPAPVHLAESALEVIHQPSRFANALCGMSQLLRMQMLIINNELWIGSAALMLIFLAMALLVERVEVIYFIAPMIAAGAISIVFGPEHDPASELTLATSTSAWKILLARLTLVSGYNFLLAICAGLGLLLISPPQIIGELILGWFGPMTFLSALALLLSLWIGTSNALFISYILWAAQYLSLISLDAWFRALSPWFDSYRQFWQNPVLMFSLGFLFIVAALWSAGRDQVQWRKTLAM